MTEEIRVLVVDDDAGARALHSRFVTETPGFVLVGTAATGESALVQSRRGVDLLLLDMRLPDISGVEVLHRLRTVGRGGPDALVISSSSDQVTVRQASAAHIVGYLVKPFTQEVLRERLLAYGAQLVLVTEHARGRRRRRPDRVQSVLTGLPVALGERARVARQLAHEGVCEVAPPGGHAGRVAVEVSLEGAPQRVEDDDGLGMLPPVRAPARAGHGVPPGRQKVLLGERLAVGEEQRRLFLLVVLLALAHFDPPWAPRRS